MLNTTKNILIIRHRAGLPHHQLITDLVGDSRGVTVVCPKVVEKVWEKDLPGCVTVSRERMVVSPQALPGGRVLVVEGASLNPATKQFQTIVEVSEWYEQTIVSQLSVQTLKEAEGAQRLVEALELQTVVYEHGRALSEHTPLRFSVSDVNAETARVSEKFETNHRPAVGAI